MTRRSGHATAAPVAHGSPWPIAPPVSERYVCGGAAADAARNGRPVVAPSGITVAIAAPAVIALSFPTGRSGRAIFDGVATETGAAISLASASSAAGTSSVGWARIVVSTPSGINRLGKLG